MLYAIKNKRTGQYVTGTDFRSHRQIMNPYHPPLLLSDYDEPENFDFWIEPELNRRRVNRKNYKIVQVKLVEI